MDGVATSLSEFSLVYENEKQLAKAYLSFVKDGGLFVELGERHQQFRMGDEVSLSVLLPKDETPSLVRGKVVWLSPQRSSVHGEAGIGVQFVGDKSHLRNRIETVLGQLLRSETPTSTM